MTSGGEMVKEAEKSAKSLGRIIFDEINIFRNVRVLWDNILHGDGRSIVRSSFRVAANVIILYSLRKMMFPIVLAIAVFTIPRLFLKKKERKTYLIEAYENELIIIDRKDKLPSLQF
uniref:Pex24p domain-containing protein n=1 Tax=Strongyloides venezuelensis TaxID=75913 RepID=A0A0K0G1F0_STRVS